VHEPQRVVLLHAHADGDAVEDGDTQENGQDPTSSNFSRSYRFT
jgi:hypothetical protein